jgi:hypothetical protein
VTARRAPRNPRPTERAIVEVTRAHLEALGYRVWADPDGHDYFDLVARRGEEIGLVEAKVAAPRAVLAQALRRRVWGNWTAVVVASERTATGLERRTEGTRAAPVGLWWVEGNALRVRRAPTSWVLPGADDPFAPLRDRFRNILDALEAGEIPAGIPWDGVVREIRRASGGRGFAEWRLDEPPT